MNFIELFKFINKYDLDNETTFEMNSPGIITYHMRVQEKHLPSPNTADLSEAITQDIFTSTAMRQGTFNTYPFTKKDFLRDFTSTG